MSLDEIVNDYHEQLLGDDGAQAYYTTRGIGEQTVLRHRLGWVLEPVVEEHKVYVGMPVVPYLTAREQAIGLRASPFEADHSGRHDLGFIEHDFPLRDRRHHLFNVGNAMPGLRTNKVHLVQDVESVLVLRSTGERAVGVPGWDNWEPAWIHLFLHSNITVHHDEESVDAVRKMTQQFKRYRIPHTESVLPDNQNLAEKMRSHE